MEGMTQLFNLSTPAKRFRFVAILEAITWLALLIAMYFKWVLGHTEAVRYPGMVHGIVFVAFVLIALATAVSLKWNRWVALLALVSSIPPFGTIVFEWWAARAGHLAELSPAQSGDGEVRVAA
ncbi:MULTISPECIES: DUF3817 domain-containing protein [unclassified Gordonia (in: high G+C Gram-positive bacteria)]